MTAADVPSPFTSLLPELLYIVLGFIRAAGGSDRPDSVVSRETKRYLSACSLTCRSWAEECRSFIFRKIMVRSDEDLRQLIAFLRSPISKIAQYITYLEIRESSTWTCLHTVPIALYKRLPQLQSLDLTCGPTASVPFVVHQLWPTRPNFPYLPHFDRTMLAYRCGLQSVTMLTLRGYRFRDLSMLLRLVGGFSVLETLRCDDVSWCEASFTPTQFRTIRSLPSNTLRTVTARSPPGTRLDHVDFLWLFARTEGEARTHRRGLFHPEEIPTLIKLARFVYRGKSEHRHMSSFARSNAQSSHFQVDTSRHELTVIKRELTPMDMPFQLTSELTVSTLGATQGLTNYSSCVRSLSITRCEHLILGLQQIELAEFRGHLEQLHGLQRVEYLFSEGCLHFPGTAQEQVHLMQQLSIGLGGVKFMFTTVVGSIRYDTAAYLGMIFCILSSEKARESCIQDISCIESFLKISRREVLPSQERTALQARSRALLTLLSPPLMRTLSGLDKRRRLTVLKLLVEMLRTDHFKVLDSAHGHSREGFLMLVDSIELRVRRALASDEPRKDMLLRLFHRLRQMQEDINRSECLPRSLETLLSDDLSSETFISPGPNTLDARGGHRVSLYDRFLFTLLVARWRFELAFSPHHHGNVAELHQNPVQEYARNDTPHAVRARIRKHAYGDGTDPGEPEYCTASFKLRGKDLGSHHIYQR